MCALLLGLLSTATHAACGHVTAQTSQCRTSSNVELARRDEFYQNVDPQDNFFTQLQQESLQKVEVLQNDPAFQETVKTLQNNSSQYTAVNSGPETQGNLNEASLSKANLYIFISFSLGETALLNLEQEAKRFGATLVLRGFKDGSYIQTAKALQKIISKTGQGILVDPELFTLFNIMAVPTFVLAKPFNLISAERIQTPIHDKLQGHVSTHYALEAFAKEGDLNAEAQALLRGNLLSRGASK